MLQLDVEFLTGVARLASDPSDPAPDWPPQPDRVFSALVASWGALGEPPAERAALEWLEAQPAPDIFAIPRDQTAARPMVDVYVPVNDETARRKVPDKAKAIRDALAVLPSRRTRQKRGFQVCSLPSAQTHLKLLWPLDPSADHLVAMEKLARATSYLGHSASLVRMRFLRIEGNVDAGTLKRSTLRAAPYAGRLRDLEQLHRRHMAGDSRARPRPSPRLPVPEASTKRANVFSPDWLVLAHVGGDRPDLLAAATISRRLRCALMSALPQPVPAWVSGHTEDQAPAREPHMAVVPLANVGWDHADGRLMGLAVIVPHAIRAGWDEVSPKAWRERRVFEGAFSNLMQSATSDEAREADGDSESSIRLCLGSAGVWRLVVDPAPAAKSLRKERYVMSASVFHTVTPIALDRHLKESGEASREEAAQIIAAACLNIGLPHPAKVEVYKHSAVRGAPSAWPAGGAPRHPTWARPDFLKQRKLVHARIEFSAKVEGPVILGAGRFAGLGLCLPAPEVSPA